MKKRRERIKRLLALVLSTAMLTTMAGYGEVYADDTSSDEKVIVTADGELDGSLDPAGFALQSWNGFAKLCSLPLIS